MRCSGFVNNAEIEAREKISSVSVSFFLDTGANINTITRSELARIQSVGGFRSVVTKSAPASIQLPGKHSMKISGDRVHFYITVPGKLAPIISFEEFIVFEDCDEPLSLGVLAISRLFGTAEIFSVSLPEDEKPLDEISFTKNDATTVISV
jgi:hypothetical protein